MEELKMELRQLLAKDLKKLFGRLWGILAKNSALMDDLVLQQAQYEFLLGEKHRGTISFSNAQLVRKQIHAAMLYVIEKISEEDLQEQSVQKEGVLLYHIPSVMPLREATRCLTRLAIEQAIAEQGLPADMAVNSETVSITEIMQVELISLQPGAFEILAPSQEQFIKRAQYTEWVFYVTPQRAGRQVLLLKVSAIEKVQNREVKRDIVLEKPVEVTAEPSPVEEKGATFERYQGAIHIQESPANAPAPARQLVQNLQTDEAGKALLKGLFQNRAIDPTAVAGGNSPLEKLQQELSNLQDKTDEGQLREGILEGKNSLLRAFVQQSAARTKQRFTPALALFLSGLLCFSIGGFGPSGYRNVALAAGLLLSLSAGVVFFLSRKQQGRTPEHQDVLALKADILKILRWERGL